MYSSPYTIRKTNLLTGVLAYPYNCSVLTDYIILTDYILHGDMSRDKFVHLCT